MEHWISIAAAMVFQAGALVYALRQIKEEVSGLRKWREHFGQKEQVYDNTAKAVESHGERLNHHDVRLAVLESKQ